MRYLLGNMGFKISLKVGQNLYEICINIEECGATCQHNSVGRKWL